MLTESDSVERAVSALIREMAEYGSVEQTNLKVCNVELIFSIY